MSEESGLVQKVWRRLQFLVTRGRATIGEDSGNVQFWQVSINNDRTIDKCPRPQEYGFASMPVEGTDFVIISIGGDLSNSVIVASNSQAFRLKNLAPGESAQYDNIGKHIYLAKDGIEVEAANQPVTINNATVVTINAATKIRMVTPLLEVTGDIIDNAGTNATSVAEMRTIYNGHDHAVQGIQTGLSTVTTDAPTDTE